MSDYPQGTNTTVIVSINADSSAVVSALDTRTGPRIHVELDGRGVCFVGDPEDVLRFARALLFEVERSVPASLLMDEWDKADEVPA